MCGIAGLVGRGPEPIPRQALAAMAAALRHRGPDAEGLFVDCVGLAHRRLSVIDTSEAGRQPLFNEERTIAVVANGEIYNFQQLRRELEARGHRFTSRSDSEVIVHSWEEYGPQCLERLHGMFAFALYDANQRVLFLARDRLGKKPLYYFSRGGVFAFASEIKALRVLPEFPSELDVQALGEYAAYGNTLGERSIFTDVRSLLPGHSLTLDLRNLEGHTPRLKRYWDVAVETGVEGTEGEWLERLDEALTEAVSRRLISDVPLGAFLSGGIDSSLVVAYMSRLSSERVKTFTIGFGEASHDEAPLARAVAKHLGTAHHERCLDPDAVAIVDRLVDVYDEPFADESAVPTLCLAQMASQHVTVALSGDGGDEGFLGYRRYPLSAIGDSIAGLMTPIGRAGLRRVERHLALSSWAKRYCDRFSRRGFDLYHHAMGFSDENLGILRREIREQLLAPARGKMAADFERIGDLSAAERFAQVDLRNYLPSDVLVKVDRASMHYALEVRSPLLDHQVIELAARIPTHLKLRGMTGKYLLRKLLSRFLPDNLVQGPKKGFGVPLKQWFRGELRPLLEEMVADPASPTWDYLDRAGVMERVHLHQKGRADLHVSLWRALCFDRWMKRECAIKPPR